MDALFEMRLNNELSSDEFISKKKELVLEKEKFEGLINDTSDRVSSWIDKADELLTFSKVAKKKFETGSLKTKKEILSCLGSNLSLKDGKFSVLLNPVLNLIGNFSGEIKSIAKRLEPHKTLLNQRDYECLYIRNEKWGE